MYYSFGPLIKDSVSSTISKDCLKFYASITKFWLIFLKSLLSQHEISIYGHIFFISLFCLLSTTINFCFKSYIPNNSNSLGLHFDWSLSIRLLSLFLDSIFFIFSSKFKYGFKFEYESETNWELSYIRLVSLNIFVIKYRKIIIMLF